MRWALLLWPMAFQALEAQHQGDTGWISRLQADAHFARALPPARGIGFSGGAPFLSVPADRPISGGVIAGVAYRGTPLSGRIALQGGDAVNAWSARVDARGAFRLVREASVEANAGSLGVGGGVFPSRLSPSQDAEAPDAVLSPSMLRDFMPWRHAGAWARIGAPRVLELEVQALSDWELTGTGGIRGGAVRAEVAPTRGRALRLRGYHLRAPRDTSPLRRLSGAALLGHTRRFAGAAEIQLGSQERSSTHGRAAHWWSYVVAGRWKLSRRAGWAARFERFDDDKRIVLPTGEAGGVPNAPMRGYSETAGVYFASSRRVLWRAEIRAFQNSGSSFPGPAAARQSTLAWVMTGATLTF